jgi:hypothetical protein
MGCSSDTAQVSEEPPETESEPPVASETDDEADDEAADSPSALPWFDIDLTDVQTGESFTVAEQGDGPVLIQAFAVW